MQRNANILSYSTGFVLLGMGTLADLFAGLNILSHHWELGILAHISAVAVWTMGLMLVDKCHTPLLAVLASILFPGAGMLGWTVANGASNLTQRRKKAKDHEENQVDIFSDMQAAIEAPFEMPMRTVVEVLHTNDSKLKRAALNLICQVPSPQSMTLVRGFLADPDPDVRALAAVAVSRLESRMSELVKSALDQVELQPQNPDQHTLLGDVYFDCANQSVPGSMNRSFYLAQSRRAFENALAFDPTRDADRITLAQVLLNLREIEKAWDTLAGVLTRETHESFTYTLGLEIAFRARRMDRVIELAEQACEALPENDEALPMLKWWLAFESSSHAKFIKPARKQ